MIEQILENHPSMRRTPRQMMRDEIAERVSEARSAAYDIACRTDQALKAIYLLRDETHLRGIDPVETLEHLQDTFNDLDLHACGDEVSDALNEWQDTEEAKRKGWKYLFRALEEQHDRETARRLAARAAERMEG